MVETNHIRNMLAEKRRELAEQLDAIDRAIAALNSTAIPVAETRPVEQNVASEHAASSVLPRTVKARRMLSAAHREAISAGKRRARAARDAAKGLVREMPDESFVPAIKTQGRSQEPRLVKRTIQKEPAR